MSKNMKMKKNLYKKHNRVECERLKKSMCTTMRIRNNKRQGDAMTALPRTMHFNKEEPRPTTTMIDKTDERRKKKEETEHRTQQYKWMKDKEIVHYMNVHNKRDNVVEAINIMH